MSGVLPAQMPDEGQLGEFARALSATHRGTLGQPRAFAIAEDGSRVCFLRAMGPDDPRQGLWLEGDQGSSDLLVHPDQLVGGEDLTEAELVRRERTREHATGITAFGATSDLSVVTFAHAGQLYVMSILGRRLDRLAVPGPVADPRPSPDGASVAWVADRALMVARIDGGDARVLAAEDDPDVSWGLAEFIAAEEMNRLRGFWWAPDGTALAATRVDVGPVMRWQLHDPTDPAAPCRVLRYPAAGTSNAVVGLEVFDLQGGRRPLAWDHEAAPYLAHVQWDHSGPLIFAVQSRDQRRLDVVTADASGATRVIRSIVAQPWVALVDGVPRWTPDGRLVTVEDDPLTDTRHAKVDGDAISPAGLHIDAVLAARHDDVVVQASADDPTATVIWRLPYDRSAPEPLSPLTGTHDAIVTDDTMIMRTQHGHDTAWHTAVHRRGQTSGLAELGIELPVQPQPIFAKLTPAKLRTALLLPSWYREGALPVLVYPYGGPSARRVRQAARTYLSSQWFAEAGFAVLVIDGRGTSGRGLAWEHAVAGDLASAALDDQVAGLHAAAQQWPMLDLLRVAIRGWSFGGFLAALAVLRRPDVFHAAVAGAPVTDWRLYDTHYTERYLGDPVDHGAAYERSSLLCDAPSLRRPLMLLHGLADDNVVAAHSLRLSHALLRAGRPHTLLPLAGTSHIPRDPQQEAGLMLTELAFLRSALDGTFATTALQ